MLQVVVQALPGHLLTAYVACSFRLQRACRLVAAATTLPRVSVLVGRPCAFHFLLVRQSCTQRVNRRNDQKKDTSSGGVCLLRGAGWLSSSSVNKHTRLFSCGRGVATAKGVSSLVEAADFSSSASVLPARHAAHDSLAKSSGGPQNIF